MYIHMYVWMYMYISVWNTAIIAQLIPLCQLFGLTYMEIKCCHEAPQVHVMCFSSNDHCHWKCSLAFLHQRQVPWGGRELWSVGSIFSDLLKTKKKIKIKINKTHQWTSIRLCIPSKHAGLCLWLISKYKSWRKDLTQVFTKCYFCVLWVYFSGIGIEIELGQRELIVCYLRMLSISKYCSCFLCIGIYSNNIRFREIPICMKIVASSCTAQYLTGQRNHNRTTVNIV